MSRLGGWCRCGAVRAWPALAVACVAAWASGWPAPTPASSSPYPVSPVSVYPIAGDRYDTPGTQLTFRGINPANLGPIQVVGSQSGTHTGHVEADSDGDGGSFIPDKPFTPGETVTVRTKLNIVGGKHGVYHFGIEHPGPTPGVETLPRASGGTGVRHFYSRPDLTPTQVIVGRNKTPASQGDIFVAPQFGPDENGPEILTPSGQLVWFDPLSEQQNMIATDFRVQELHNQRVLTWWQGTQGGGSGRGEGIIDNDHYDQIATVQAGNGLKMDLHEFVVTNNGDAWIIAAQPLRLKDDVRTFINAVVQEIDIKTGLVLFQWDALDHLNPNYSYKYSDKSPGHILDPYHVNSISFDAGGNPVISMRDMWAIYDVDRSTGQIKWTLGGKHSSFKMGKNAQTAFQHDAVLHPGGQLTAFDDGAGPPRVHPQSRGVRLAINYKTKSVSLVSQYFHSPALSANYEGSLQPLSGGDVFLDWGQQPYFSEDNAKGQEIYDAHFAVPSASYRAYRYPWSAQPDNTVPALVAVHQASGENLYASWNGATDVARWQVLAGDTATDVTPVGSIAASGFETQIPAPSGSPVVQVQALSSSGALLSTSATITVPGA